MDAVFSVGLEFNMTGGVKPLNGLDESEDSSMYQVLEKDVRRKPVVDSLGDVLDLRKLFQQEALALGRVRASESLVSGSHGFERLAGTLSLSMCC